MRKSWIILLFVSLSGFCQTGNVKSFQLGVLGSWIQYEHPLGSNATFELEIGMNGGLFKQGNGVGYIFVSTVNLEPKYYYSLSRRVRKSKNTKNNSANYVSLSVLHYTDWISIGSENNYFIITTSSIVPKFGIRRSLSSKLIFEFGLGIGTYLNEVESGAAGQLDLKVGYVF